LHVVDYAAPRNLPMRLIAALVRPLEEAADHFDGLLPAQVQGAGFATVEEIAHFDTPLGPLAMLMARKRDRAS
jgi:hypothetical protein